MIVVRDDSLYGSGVGAIQKTGDRVKIPAMYVPHFKVRKELKKRVNKGG